MRSVKFFFLFVLLMSLSSCDNNADSFDPLKPAYRTTRKTSKVFERGAGYSVQTEGEAELYSDGSDGSWQMHSTMEGDNYNTRYHDDTVFDDGRRRVEDTEEKDDPVSTWESFQRSKWE
ncbi:MAG: hypothetical protein WC732_01380 [Candidatus Omnitrophota bacterium]